MADTPNVSAPASGSYGEKAALVALKQALPTGAVGTPAPTPTTPPVSQEPIAPPTVSRGRPNTGAAAPPGVPSVLLSPTQQPNVPANTPLAPQTPPPPTAAVQPDQQRLQLLDQLANGANVSETTRAWAQRVIALLLGNG